MASTDATPIPIKNQAYRITFPIFDADGDLVTGAAGLDSEYSGDAGAFADCTNEATEIAAASGMYYLDLTAAEMNYDTVAVIIKTSTSGAKTTPIVLYPSEVGDYVTIADEILKRSVSTIEGSAADHSLATVILAILESLVSAGTWTIYESDGVTPHLTRTVQSSASAEPITKVSS